MTTVVSSTPTIDVSPPTSYVSRWVAQSHGGYCNKANEFYPLSSPTSTSSSTSCDYRTPPSTKTSLATATTTWQAQARSRLNPSSTPAEPSPTNNDEFQEKMQWIRYVNARCSSLDAYVQLVNQLKSKDRASIFEMMMFNGDMKDRYRFHNIDDDDDDDDEEKRFSLLNRALLDAKKQRVIRPCSSSSSSTSESNLHPPCSSSLFPIEVKLTDRTINDRLPRSIVSRMLFILMMSPH